MPFRIGLSGLNAASADLEVTGNNIANAGTVGFKESRAEFADVFANSYGDITKTAIGSGVRLEAVTQQFSQGNIDFTDNALDLAINGEGFFVLNDNGEQLYTRAGAFQVNRDGFVVNSAGQRLQVFPPVEENSPDPGFSTGQLSDLQLDFGDNPPRPTSEIDMSINLSSEAEQIVDEEAGVINVTADPANTGAVTESRVYVVDSSNPNYLNPFTLTYDATNDEYTYDDGTGTQVPVAAENVVVSGDKTTITVNGWAMELYGTPADGDQFSTAPEATATVGSANTSAVTVSSLAVLNSSDPDILDPATLVYQGANAAGDEQYLLNGKLVLATVSGGQHVISENGWELTLSGAPDVGDEFSVTFEPGAPVKFDQTDPETYQYSTALTLYDSLGAPRTATMYFVKTENTLEWEAYVDLSGSNLSPPQPQGPVKLTFDSNGVMTSPTTATDFTFDLANYDPVNGGLLGEIDPVTGEATGVVSIDFSDITQFGPDYSVDDLNQDGFTTGRLVGFDVDQSGVVFARYTNGQAAALGQVALANFTNPQGLLQLGDNNWAESYAAGDVVYGEAGTSSLGLVQSGGLEASNVDLAEELVNLIIAQRNYQANAQTISTADAITQTIINIR
ncbi:hypothetical protein AY586_01925 [Marichromatium gracile]|uniref:Flagellar hook protein FlgE n=1 Tax=Marichromatium gracile TaxID=1048 RepID=A0ABR5VKW6_MARGR|nr:hypothetical protein AY586_01925 [Marichromatium gracile]